MGHAIIIAVEMQDKNLVKSTLTELKKLPNVEVVQWYAQTGEKGALTTNITPDIIIIDDDPEATLIFGRIKNLQASFPQAAIFVISTIERPKHIVDVMKAGVAEYLIAPIESKHLVDSIEEVRAHLTNSGKIAKGVVHSFISSKGGLGASMIATNTAVALSMHEAGSVALCDLSLQSGDCSVFLDLLPLTTIVDVCRKIHGLDIAMLRGAMCKHSSRVELLAAPEAPEDSEEVTPAHLRKILDLCAKIYDHTIIDCQSMFINEISMEAFKASKNIFVLTDLSVPSVRNAFRIAKLIQEMGINREKIQFVANRFVKSQTNTIKEVESSLHKRLYWLFPNDFEEVLSAINEGIPVMQLHPQATLSRNIVSFTQKLRDILADQEFRGARGTFGRAI